jgi:5-(carboxyamino)imidazole ribonucleotide synthase
MRIGVVGGGQLARMLAMAAYPLGMQVTVLDASSDASAGQVADLVHGDFSDRKALGRLADASDVVTFDFENVPAASADWLAARVPVRPGARALEMSQDRIAEKELFTRLGIPTPRFAPVDGTADLEAAISVTGLPAVLKTRRLGYDGKGQRVVRDMSSAMEAVEQLGSGLVLESFVDFERELSIIAVRGMGGEVAFYPMVENLHRDGILRHSSAPATATAHAQDARDAVERLLVELDYVGVFTLELFETTDGLLANEFAPRVHNSGHWTIEGAVTSQFENHLRAVAGLPLGSTAPRGASVMVNFIGSMPDADKVLSLPGAHLHDYGKRPRPGRKLGHATLNAPAAEELDPVLARLITIARG